MGGMPLDTAAIMSTVLEGILYGASVLMFLGTMWTLSHKHRTQEINRPIAAVAISLLMLSTAHIIVGIVRLEDGLVKYRDTFPGGPPAFFADITQETFVIKNVIYVMQTLLGDGVIIYRCYVVWRSVWIVLLPSMLWCGVGVTGFAAAYAVSHATSNAGDVFASATGQWINGFFALTLASNMLSSGLLAYRIWMIECSISKARATAGTSMTVLRVLVDAALLYSVALLPALICFASSNNGQFVMIDLINPIISIAFYMVLIRISIGQSHHYLFRGGSTSEAESGNLRQLAMKPMQVHISRFMQNDATAAHQDQPLTMIQAEVYGKASRDV